MGDVRREVDLKSPVGRDQHSQDEGTGGVGSWRPPRRSPVSEVQNSLDGVTTTCGDVTLKTREQRQKHIDSEALTLPGMEVVSEV